MWALPMELGVLEVEKHSPIMQGGAKGNPSN